MPSTRTVQDVANVGSIFHRAIPLTGLNGVANEPALTIANSCIQTILSPPFGWAWNRATLTFDTVAGTQSYAQAVSDFGWLEAASVTSAGGTFDLDVRLLVGDDSNQQRPAQIAAQADNGSGQITFKLLPVPDQAYTVNITYQQAPAVLTALTDTFAPIPDYLSSLVDELFRARVYELMGDPRLPLLLQAALQRIADSAQRQAAVSASPVIQASLDRSVGIPAPPKRR
jgi:hypothetical protein